MVPEHSSKWLTSRANETVTQSQQTPWQALHVPASTSLSGPLLLQAFHCPNFQPRSYENQIFFSNSAKGSQMQRSQTGLGRRVRLIKKETQTTTTKPTNIFTRKTLLKDTVRKNVFFIYTNWLWTDKFCYVCHAISLATLKRVFWRGKTSLFLTKGQNDISGDWCRPYMNTTLSITNNNEKNTWKTMAIGLL